MSKPIRCILLVDDDPDDNFLHRLVIEESGLCEHVRETTSGAEALRYLTNPDASARPFPDVVLLDVNLPGMSGFDFLEALRRWVPNLPGSPVVMLFTASVNPAEQAQAATLAEVDGYHVKPLTANLLHDLVNRRFRD
jgi:CheY-like chemotaxis protein